MDSLLAAGQIGVRPKMSDMLTNGKTQHLRRVILGASSQIMQQIDGCNVNLDQILIRTALAEP
jgi:hypothetical protein